MADKSILIGNIKAILDQTEEQIRPIFTEVMTPDNNIRIMESEKCWEISEHEINQLDSFGIRNFLITHWLAYRSGQMIAQILLRDWSRKQEIEKKFGKMLALAHWLGQQTPRGISTVLRLAEDLIIGPDTYYMIPVNPVTSLRPITP